MEWTYWIPWLAWVRIYPCPCGEVPAAYRKGCRFCRGKPLWEAQGRWAYCVINVVAHNPWLAAVRALYGVVIFRLFRQYGITADGLSAWWYRW